MAQQQQCSAVMFILDCSASMVVNNRFEQARQSLREILDTLLHVGNYHVGLSAYGHRSRWQIDEGKFVSKPKADLPAARIPDSPDEDFETLVTMQRLDDEHSSRLIDALTELDPYGVTPLYWSLEQTLIREFDITRPGDAKHIVLITDGLDEQRHVSANAASVAEVWQEKKDVRIDVLFVDGTAYAKDTAIVNRFPGGAVEIRQRIEQLKNLAETTGGTYVEPVSQALTSALQDAIQPVATQTPPER